ncbi:MAG TPA: hypothetical protein DCL77_19755 [Prolixibacteraceae bacterium]|jgi:hypothetical protein|nr:hypothetical protein [Prolixibacteraceae bacterium]
MDIVAIEVKCDADVKFWLKMAKKTGVKAKSINIQDIADLVLADLIEKGMKSRSVSSKSVMKVLGNKTDI